MSKPSKSSPVLTRSTSSSSNLLQSTSSKSDPSIADVIKAIKALRSTQDKLIADNKILGDELKLRLDTLTSRLDTLANEITILRTKVDTIDTRVVALESKSQSTSISDIVQELTARERCKSNLIVHGLPESTATVTSSMLADDKTAINTILTKMSIEPTIDYKLIRLGRQSPTSHRPIKLIFNGPDISAQVLSKFRLIKSRPDFPPHFSIVRDKTALEREKLKACHQELDRRVQSGENDLTIAYRNGIPSVLKTHPKNQHASRRRIQD